MTLVVLSCSSWVLTGEVVVGGGRAGGRDGSACMQMSQASLDRSRRSANMVQWGLLAMQKACMFGWVVGVFVRF